MRVLEKRICNTYYTTNEGSIGRYLNDISKYKILSDAEIKDEIKKAKKGNQESVDKIVSSNQRFVFSLAKRFSKGSDSLLCDLINEANIGLIKSIQYFDTKKEETFLTYSVYWMLKHIHLYMNYIDPMIKVSNKSKTSKVSTIINKFFLINGRNPTSEEIITELKEKYGIRINEESDLFQLNKISIDTQSITEKYDDFSSFYLENEKIPSDSEICSNNGYEDIIERDYSKTIIEKSMMILTERERNIVELLYGIKDYREHKVQEIADQLGITNEAVRQINKRALDKLKEDITEKKFTI